MSSQLSRARSGRTMHRPLLVCFSHIRWDFVFQRPQHLLTRAARTHEVIYFEEPIFEAGFTIPKVSIRAAAPSVSVATPMLPSGMSTSAIYIAQRKILEELLATRPHPELITWYYTPMSLAFSQHLEPNVCIYDCMDELSAFKNPPAGLVEREAELFARADIVFTGGESLYRAKRERHSQVYAFPSSIDVPHFNKARATPDDPLDQAEIPKPRLGFFGVIDERMDLDLVSSTAARMPDVHFVMLGPTVKIDPATLPQAPNLHWLGSKSYAELPAYLAHWSAGWMPFALNEATRFISPTKTPEFLAAGVPIVSTAIADVVRPYGVMQLVEIADQANVVGKIRSLLAREDRDIWLTKVDRFLADKSWDKTWEAMQAHVDRVRAVHHVGTMRLGA